jgi:hypothetical protein
LIERRRKWFAAIARTAQAVRMHEAAVKSLRRLKVKLTIERREKEAEVAAVKTELDLAVAAEKVRGGVGAVIGRRLHPAVVTCAQSCRVFEESSVSGCSGREL